MEHLPGNNIADFTGPDPEEFIRLTGAVTAAEAGEGIRAFTDALDRFTEATP